MGETFKIYLEIISELEKNRKSDNRKLQINFEKNKKKDLVYLNLFPKCEPQLDKRGLYRKIGGVCDLSNKEIFNQLTYLWILNYSDGNHSLEEIANLSNIDLETIKESAKLLETRKILKKYECEKFV